MCLLLNACDANNDVAMLYSYPKQGACSIDNPERHARINNDTDLLIRGWAYDAQTQLIPETLSLYFVNEKTQEFVLANVERGELRGDVATAFGNPALEKSGFRSTFPKNKLTAGKYTLILLQIDRKSGVIACNGEPHKITVN